MWPCCNSIELPFGLIWSVKKTSRTDLRPNSERIQILGEFNVSHHGLEGRIAANYHFALNEIADDLVVEVFDGGPPDAFLYILFLQGR